MEGLLYFTLWAGLIFLMMRFGCGAHVMGHGRGSGHKRGGAASSGQGDLAWMPPKRDADPVCRKTVTTEKAKSSVFDGKVYYFCSRECREAFEAAPDIYVDSGQEGVRGELEHTHA